jgi:hypothetical protein
VLREAGLSRVTGQLDSPDDGVFRAMNDRDVPKNRLGCADFPQPLVALLGERPQLEDARHRQCCSAAGLSGATRR